MSTRLPFHTLWAAALVCVALPAQSWVGPYDHNGDGPGLHAVPPGAVWNTLSTSLSAPTGIGVMPDGTILVMDSGAIQGIDPVTGNTVATFPVDGSDFGVTFDYSRNLIVTTDSLDDVVRGYVPGNPVPVFSWPFPGTGYVGIAWDTLRDWYWMCDWSLDLLVAVDAGNGAVTASYSLAALGNTRSCGVAYDCMMDTVIVGDRDSVSHFVIRASDGTLVTTYPSVGAGSSDPRGAAMSPRSGIWTASYNLPQIYELENMVPAPGSPAIVLDNAGTASVGSTVTISMSNASPDLRAVFGGSLSATGSVVAGISNCLGLQVHQLGSASLVAGAGSYSFTVPNILGRTVYLQAAALPSRSVSNLTGFLVVP